MRSGLSHRKTVLVLYGISLFALAGGVLVFSNQGRYFPLFIGFLMVTIIFFVRVTRNNPLEMKRALLDSLESRNEIQNLVRLSRWFVAEVDHYESGLALWEDYQFLLKKLGFAKVSVEIDGVNKECKIKSLVDVDLFESQFFYFSSEDRNNKIQFFADTAEISERRFLLFSEIANESWTLALKRWKELKQTPFQLEGE